MRWLAVLLVLLFTLPVLAQDEDVIIDPYGELTESITIGTITVNYPAGISLIEGSGQAVLVLGAGSASSEDNITIATTSTFEAVGVDISSVMTVSEGVYGFLASAYGDTREFADVTTETILAGYPATVFEVIGTETTRKTIVYVLEVDGTILAAILTTFEASFSVNVEWMLMARIVENLTIDGEPIYTPVIRPAPTDAVELVESVGLFEGILVVSVPEGWLANSSQALFASSESALAQMEEDLPALADDEIVMQFFPPERTAQLPAVVINTRTVVGYFVGNYPDSIVETYEGFGENAYYVAVVSEDVPAGTFLIVTQLTDNPADVMAVLGVAPDFATQEATILAIINGVAYTPAEE
jgi:hypothetical protein